MNLFKFNFITDPTILTNGQFINGATSVMWVERYFDSGEFEIKAPFSSQLREFLPLGTLISHIDTMEVMIVENHHILDQEGRDPELSITGRSFDTYLENRIVGTYQARGSTTLIDVGLSANYTPYQIVTLINMAISTGIPDDSLAQVLAQTDLTIPAGGVSEERYFDMGTVYDAVRDLLAIDDLGIRTIRKNPFGIGTGADTKSLLNVYSGSNKTNKVQFSWKAGDFDKLEHLFSQKNLKNSAMIVSRWCWTVVDLGPTNYDRRIMLVDVSGLDKNASGPPTPGTPLSTFIAKMQLRGRQALKRQKEITIASADISNLSQYRYRQDYSLGDLVSLDGNYGDIVTARVVEYAEIEDENGKSGHPTLSIPGT